MRSCYRLTAAAAVVTVLASGCSAEAGPTKAGGSARPVILHIGTDDAPGLPAADMIEDFARRVSDLSGGAVVIEPVWHAAGTPTPREWDQVVARRVVSGDLELALVPTRAWDTEGVTSLRALNAPFLITSESVLDEVVSGELVPELLGGLDEVGVTGLVLLPEGMRHVFGWGRAPASLADFDGATIRAPRSDAVAALFEALGARADDPDGTAFADGVADGSIAAAESSFILAGGLPGARPTAAGNLVFFPKVQSLVANTEALEALSDDQQAALRDAATATLDWALGQSTTDAEAAAQFCEAGGTVTMAAPSDLRAIEAATRVVYDELEREPVTRDLIDEIEQVRAQAPTGPTSQPCEPTANPSETAGGGTGDQGDFPEGVYRLDISADELVAAGAGESWAGDVAGQWTMSFDDGELSMVDVNARSGIRYEALGTYCVTDDRVSIDLFEDEKVCGDGVYFDAAWRAEGEGLSFLDVTPQPGENVADVAALYGSKVWRKIG